MKTDLLSYEDYCKLSAAERTLQRLVGAGEVVQAAGMVIEAPAAPDAEPERPVRVGFGVRHDYDTTNSVLRLTEAMRDIERQVQQLQSRIEDGKAKEVLE
ncbi:hypothetical protein [uncultured Hoeflea sp.]|uniref:hypothetical protein n=1 Tax=uncultured Hoeflea sp. TaxID=538666 RepID=UPI0030DAF9CA|tara:strand:+ start:163 stop:462 length:300 start_codon:yes stop_codon:yes gene_type:complete